MRKWIVFIAATFTLLARSGFAEEKDLLIFGDSLSDTGAGYALSGNVIPPSPPYYNGRYSNGPNWVDYVTNLLETENQNYAVGGAETGSENSLSVFGWTQLGGLTQQIERFQAANASNSHHLPIRSDQLTIVEIGANNFLSLLSTPSKLNPAGVTAAVIQGITELAGALQTLQALGAKKTIVWNLPNLGEIPEFNNGLPLSALAPLFSAASNAYNGALLTVVQKLNDFASHERQIYYFDANSVLQGIRANLQAQGVDLTEHTLTTLFSDPPIAVVTGPSPDNLAFYDQEHPTTLVWRLFATQFAGYVDNLIDGPRFFGAQPDLLFEGAKAHRDLLGNHYRTINVKRYVCDDCCDCDRFEVYFDGEGKWGTTRTRRGTRGMNFDSQTYLIGADYTLNPCWILGASFAYQRSKGNVHNHRGHISLNDYVPTVYAVLTKPNFYVDADFSYHVYDFNRLKRNIDFVNLKTHGHTRGWGVEWNLQSGYLCKWRCLTTGPVIGTSFETVHIDRYREKGASTFNYRVNDQHQDSCVSTIGWQAFWNQCDCRYVPFAELVYEHEWLRRRKTLRPILYSIDDHAINYHHTSEPDQNWMKLDIGVDVEIMKCMIGNISYIGETTFRRFNHAVQGELNISF